MVSQDILTNYIPLIQAVTTLFAPFLEVAIHDLKTGKIIAIYNNLSNRKVGDASPILELKIPTNSFPDVFEPYYETNWNGHRIKCTTVTIRDNNKNPILLICFNFDTAVFQDIHMNLKTFLEVPSHTSNPVELFGDNWQKKIDESIESWLMEKKLLKNNLTRIQKKDLIEYLSQQSIFFFKNAPQYVANQLHLSRATIYNHLKILRAT